MLVVILVCAPQLVGWCEQMTAQRSRLSWSSFWCRRFGESEFSKSFANPPSSSFDSLFASIVDSLLQTASTLFKSKKDYTKVSKPSIATTESPSKGKPKQKGNSTETHQFSYLPFYPSPYVPNPNISMLNSKYTLKDFGTQPTNRISLQFLWF